MSESNYGFPVRKGFDFGLDGGIGPTKRPTNLGSRTVMTPYIVASKILTATTTATGPLMVWETPPMPQGSFMRVSGHLSSVGGDTIVLGHSLDWNVAVPSVTALTNATNLSGSFLMLLSVRARTTCDASISTGGSSSIVITNGIDFSLNNRWAVHHVFVGGILSFGALVEVFIPRAYR